MLVDNTMSKPVVTVDRNSSILQARAQMTAHGIRHLPVVDTEERLIGIVTDRDIRSALPFGFSRPEEAAARPSFAQLTATKIQDIMTRSPYTISPSDTIQDALMLFWKIPVGAFPVVDENRRVVGIISVRDLLRGFIQVLGISEPGTLVAVMAPESPGQIKKIVDIVTAENIPLGSVMVVRNWKPGYRAVFAYLFSQNVRNVLHRLEASGLVRIDPMQWFVDRVKTPGESNRSLDA